MTKNHCILYNGKMIPAVYFTNIFENVYRIKYRGQILYNVLMKKHSQMEIHNFICETLHPTEQNNHKRKCKKEILALVSSRPVWRIDKNTNEKIEFYKTIRDASQWVFDNNLTSVKEFNNGNNIKTKISAVAQGRT